LTTGVPLPPSGAQGRQKAVDIDGGYTETLARIDSTRPASGVRTRLYENNADMLKVATVEGVTPSVEPSPWGEFPVSRPLFFYVRRSISKSFRAEEYGTSSSPTT